MGKDSKLYAFLGIFLSVIGFIIVYATQKKDKYAMFYAKQGLVLFFVWIVFSIVSWVFMMIPFIGTLISIILWILLIIAWVIGMIYSLSDEEKEIPVIGQFAKLIKIQS